MSRTYKDRFSYKGFDSQCVDTYRHLGFESRFQHHRGRTTVYFNAGPAWWFKPPTWFTKMTVRSKARRQTRDLLRLSVRTPLEELDDLPFFPHHSLPNADWDWT